MTSVFEARNHSRGVFSGAQKAYREWINTGSAYVHREDALFDKLSELAEIGREYHALESPLFALQYRFALAWEAVKPGILNSTESGFMIVGDVWALFDKIEDYWTEASRQIAKTLEPLSELKGYATPITDEQIAKMYGWMKEDGSPDTDRVRAELAKPPADRITPENPQQKINNEAHAEIVAKVRYYRGLRASRIAALSAIAPEDIADLIRPKSMGGQGVSADQIARMKRMTVEEVFAEADRLGLPRPQSDYSAPRETRPAETASEDDGSLDAEDFTEEGSFAAEVASYVNGGYSTEEIAAFTGRTVEEVTAAIMADNSQQESDSAAVPPQPPAVSQRPKRSRAKAK